jgi:hypothetical protein
VIPLTATTDSIEVVTSAAVTVDAVVGYRDNSAAGQSKAPGRATAAISTATTTTLVSGPSAGARAIETLHLRNRSSSASVDVTVRFNANASIFELHKVTLRAGEALEYIEGVGFFLLAATTVATLFKVLAADDTGGQNVNTAQPWFPTAGAVTVAVGTYQMSGLLNLVRAAGTTSHTTSQLFGGTATVSSIAYKASVQTGDADANIAENSTFARVATATVVKAASTSATESAKIELDGIVRFSAAGTFIPQFQYSAAPGGAPTVKANSYFRLDYLGDSAATAQGAWS